MVKNPLKRKSKEKLVDKRLSEDIIEVEEPDSVQKEIPNADIELDVKQRFDLLKIFGYLFVLVWIVGLVWFIYTLLFAPHNPYMGVVPPIPIDDIIGKRVK